MPNSELVHHYLVEPPEQGYQSLQLFLQALAEVLVVVNGFDLYRKPVLWFTWYGVQGNMELERDLLKLIARLDVDLAMDYVFSGWINHLFIESNCFVSISSYTSGERYLFPIPCTSDLAHRLISLNYSKCVYYWRM